MSPVFRVPQVANAQLYIEETWLEGVQDPDTTKQQVYYTQYITICICDIKI